MDQLKTQLAAVKQHSFWVMCIGILLVSIGSWWVSTSKLSEEQTKQLGAIKTAEQGLTTIAAIQEHPNDSTTKGMDAVLQRYANEIKDGWQLQYDQQAGVLVWAEGFRDSGFLAFVDKLRPIEAIEVVNGIVNIRNDLPRDYKDEYRNYIEDELPKLAKTIGARWVVSTTGDAGGGAGGLGAGLAGPMVPGGGAAPGGLDASGQPVAPDDSIVLWDPANQQELLVTHFGFTMRASLPTTLEVLYAQEDYWVFDNIMQIIKATNGEATARHEATIKMIDFVRIGRSAMGLSGQIFQLGAAGAGGPGGMATGGEGAAAAPAGGSPDGGTAPGGMTGPPGGGEGGMGGMESMLAKDPAIMRYVDEKYAPLDATRLRGALKSTDPNDALLAVAKRMPVRMRVRIDQRKLNILLAECGNSKLPVEVRQVRINRPATPPGAAGMSGGMPGGGFSGGGDSGGSGFGGSGFGSALGGGGGMPGGMGSAFGGAMPGGGGEGGGYGMPPGGGMGGGRPGMQAGSVTQDAQVDPNMIEVELYGIVYIYNPVNKAQLNVGPPADPNAQPPADGVEPVPAPDTTVPGPDAAGVVPSPPANGGNPAGGQQ